MDLVVAVVANTTFEDRGNGGIVDLNRHIPGRMEERKLGSVEEGGGPAGAVTTEDTATLPAMLS